jgi:hypothetical protein
MSAAIVPVFGICESGLQEGEVLAYLVRIFVNNSPTNEKGNHVVSSRYEIMPECIEQINDQITALNAKRAA